MQASEEVLRLIYGDDFRGCQVSLESVAAIVDDALKKQRAHSEEIRDLYEKVVEAVHLLATPPDSTKITDPNDLRALLTERLDTISTVTRKTIDTIELVKKQRGDT